MKNRLIAIVATIFAAAIATSVSGASTSNAVGNDRELAPSSRDSARGNDWELAPSSDSSRGNDWE